MTSKYYAEGCIRGARPKPTVAVGCYVCFSYLGKKRRAVC